MAAANPPTYVIVKSNGSTLSWTPSGYPTINGIPPASGVAPFFGNPIVGPVLQVIVSPNAVMSGYTPGTYSVALTPSGSGATAEVVVVGQIVAGVTITNNGTHTYSLGDVLSPVLPFGGGTGFTCTVLALPSTNSLSLEFGGVNSLDWGQNLWTNLVRMTENFAASTAPGSNPILGGANTVPLAGQLWWNTTGMSLSVYNGSTWQQLDVGGVSSVTGTANEIIATPTTGAVVLSLAPPSPAPIAGTYTNATLTVDTFGRLTHAASGLTPTGGTVTSVSVTGSTGLATSVVNPTTTPALTLTLDANLQALAGISSLGLLYRSSANTFVTYALTASTGIQIAFAGASATFTNTGVTSLAGTANQITVSNATGGVTLSLPAAVVLPGSLSTPTTISASGTIASSSTVSGLTVNAGAGGMNSGGNLAVTGNITATLNITAYNSSDRRLKTNIKNISSALTKVNQINGVEFDWTKEYIMENGGEDGYFVRTHDVGVIAQEVEVVLPEVVATRDDGTMAVRYEKLIPLLIEAIKELKAEVDMLKKGK